MEQIIMGVDPGTSVTGYGIVKLDGSTYSTIDYGCIRPPRTLSLSGKRRVIFESMGHLLEQYMPHSLSVESQYIHKNAKSAMKLNVVGGIITLAATLRDIPVYEYAPSKAKAAVSGTGSASKEQVQEMVKRLLNLPQPPPKDAADALALAICHLHALPSRPQAI